MDTTGDFDPIGTVEWMDTLGAVQQHRGGDRSNYLINRLADRYRQVHRNARISRLRQEV